MEIGAAVVTFDAQFGNERLWDLSTDLGVEWLSPPKHLESGWWVGVGINPASYGPRVFLLADRLEDFPVRPPFLVGFTAREWDAFLAAQRDNWERVLRAERGNG